MYGCMIQIASQCGSIEQSSLQSPNICVLMKHLHFFIQVSRHIFTQSYTTLLNNVKYDIEICTSIQTKPFKTAQKSM